MSVLASDKLVSSASILGSQYVRQCGKSLIYIKNRRGPKIVPWGTPHLRYFGVDFKNLDGKSVFDYLKKKQTIDGWTNKSHSIAIFVTKYRDLLYQLRAFLRSKKTTALAKPRSTSIA